MSKLSFWCTLPFLPSARQKLVLSPAQVPLIQLETKQQVRPGCGQCYGFLCSVPSAGQTGDLEKYWTSLSHLGIVLHLFVIKKHDAQGPGTRYLREIFS